jgi:hypothetical protein
MRRRTTAAGVALIAGFALAATGALAAKLKEGELDLIANWFAGVYDTAPANGAAGDGHVLIIARVSSPMISWHVFYAEERDSSGAVIAQQFLSFELAGDKKSIVETSFSFKEPRRWQGALERPDIFKSMISDDLLPASGCEIFWVRSTAGYVGHTNAGACRLRSRTTGISMQVDIVTRLTSAEYVHGERTFLKRAVGMQ